MNHIEKSHNLFGYGFDYFTFYSEDNRQQERLWCETMFGKPWTVWNETGYETKLDCDNQWFTFSHIIAFKHLEDAQMFFMTWRSK